MNTTAPSISGDAVVGGTLVADAGGAADGAGTAAGAGSGTAAGSGSGDGDLVQTGSTQVMVLGAVALLLIAFGATAIVARAQRSRSEVE